MMKNTNYKKVNKSDNEILFDALIPKKPDVFKNEETAFDFSSIYDYKSIFSYNKSNSVFRYNDLTYKQSKNFNKHFVL